MSDQHTELISVIIKRMWYLLLRAYNKYRIEVPIHLMVGHGRYEFLHVKLIIETALIAI